MSAASHWPLLGAALTRRGEAAFLVGGAELSGDETLALTRDAGHRLRALQLVEGEIVGVVTWPSVHCLIALLALWRQGLVALPLNPAEPPAAREALCGQAGCRVVLTPDGAGAHESIAVRSQRALVEGGTEVQLPLAPGGGRCLPGAATVIATSGSSGRPKLVVHGLRQHIASAHAAAAATALGSRHRWLLSLPLSHVGGLGILFRTLISGAELALPAPGARWDTAMLASRPTHLSLVAAQLLRLLEDDSLAPALPQLACVLAGGGPLSTGLRTAALEAGLPLTVSYGSTETASLVAAAGDAATVSRAGSAGRVLPGREIRIAKSGELLVRGESLLCAYLGDDGSLPATTPDGFFATGDRGHVGPDGCLYIAGRLDQMFISGGENLQPEVIEQALLQIPDIVEAVVVPVPHRKFGARPVAFLRTRSGAAVDQPTVAHALGDRLPRFSIPDQCWPMPAGNALGLKPDRPALQRLAAARVAERGD